MYTRPRRLLELIGHISNLLTKRLNQDEFTTEEWHSQCLLSLEQVMIFIFNLPKRYNYCTYYFKHFPSF